VKLSELLALKATAQTTLGWVARSRYENFAYPYQDIATKKVSLAVATAHVLAKDNESHLVVISVRPGKAGAEKSFKIWCSDLFLEGRMSTKGGGDPVKDRCETAAAGLPDPEGLALEMQSYAGVTSVSDKCDFWKNFKGPKKELCVHTQHVLAAFFTEELGKQMEAALDQRLGTLSAGSTASGPAMSALSRYLFRVPVLIEGDRGSGKTHEARDMARLGGHPLVEVAGHEGIEVTDLLGHLVPMPDKSLAWKDGGLSQAFRKAAQGEMTVLLIDELLRIPQRQQSVLLTALSAYAGYYQLRTGRIVNVKDGVGEEEVLRCLTKNLGVVATTNVGSEYAVDQIDPAIAERWLLIRKDTTVEGLKVVLGPVSADKGFSANVVTKLIKFFVRAQELKRGGQLTRTPTTRTLVRALELAAREEDVKDMLLVQSLLWVDRDLDGFPNSEQLDLLKKHGNLVFSGSSA
jgi:hypothetical protein